MSELTDTLSDNQLAEQAALGLDGVIDRTDPGHIKHLYGLVV